MPSSRLAVSVVRFDAVRLFPVGLHHVNGLCQNKPATIDELRTNIKRELVAVSPDLFLKIVKNWVQRLDFCKPSRDGHAKEIELPSY